MPSLCQIFNMKNTACAFLAASLLSLLFAFTLFAQKLSPVAEAQAAFLDASETPQVAPPQAAVAPVSPTAAPVVVNPVIVPVPNSRFSPEQIENIVLKWVMVLTSITGAVCSFIAYVWGKVNETKRIVAAQDERMTRQDARVEKATERAEQANAKVENHLLTCPPKPPQP